MKAINISWGNDWMTWGINICFLSEVMLCYWLRGTAYCWLQARCYWIFGISQSLYMLLRIVCESRPHLSDSLWPQGLYSPWDFIPFSRGSSNPEIEPRSPTLQADLLPAEPQGNPKNTGVGNLYLLQHLPDPGSELGSPSLQEDSLPSYQGSPCYYWGQI